MTEYQGSISLERQLELANQQLIQSEKLATIGQLAAGVAHEINNPVGYVYSNLQTLRNYLGDLFRVTDAIGDAPSLEELQRVRKSVDYDFLRDDLVDLLQESLEGVDRIRKIIASLKDFSRTEEEEFELADINAGIQTTLNVVNNELKYKAEVQLDLRDIPLVECIVSQINQVVMNFLVNAAQAIEGFGAIRVRTGVQDNEVWIEIEDNGSGIKQENLDKLFEPFFTTKPAGKGTGLGLALSKSIIDKHQGRIEIDSVLDKGSSFKIWLPISQTPE